MSDIAYFKNLKSNKEKFLFIVNAATILDESSVNDLLKEIAPFCDKELFKYFDELLLEIKKL